MGLKNIKMLEGHLIKEYKCENKQIKLKKLTFYHGIIIIRVTFHFHQINIISSINKNQVI